MYVYYAYLAYVVFNLLVNVIYKCTPDELSLPMKRELLSTHYIGTYCTSKVLGVCLETKRSYCEFNSPLSQIMMEQIYKQPQMGLSWGTPKHPNCTGLAISQLNKVDWDKVDLSEWIGILIKTGNFAESKNVTIDSLTGSGSILNYSTTTPRPNVLETTIDRSSGVNADQIRSDAYQDAWSQTQTPKQK
ncbi:conjugal transfer protein TraN [Celerinatantimonas yamalensis]|uniref:Conjugal transfer protein TraN n=1 Tax=Celerinatantimonas yamalensis TaxID=559956 RepID=A0ABW9GC20_9GAMM